MSKTIASFAAALLSTIVGTGEGCNKESLKYTEEMTLNDFLTC